MNISKIYFTTDDNLKLVGLLYMPDSRGIFLKKKCDKVVVFIHGMYSNCLRKRDDIFAEELNKNGIAYFTFNNRGAEMANLNRELLYGTAFENPKDGSLDIEAAIRAMGKHGFKHIHILAHSLGCNKALNWYPEKGEAVDSIGLLSLTALSDKYKQVAGDKAYKTAIEIAKLKVLKNKGMNLLPKEFYPKPISANTFLTLFDETDDFNSVFYENEDWKADSLNEISEPLFMRYGTVNETITKEPDAIVDFVKTRIKNDNLDIGYIDGADHSYHGREKILIEQYIKFINKHTNM